MPFENLTGWKRTFGRWIFLVFLILLFVNSVFNALSFFDRRELHVQATESREKSEFTEVVKQSRARIILMLINSATENRKLTDKEVEEINSLKKAAEFDVVEK